MAEKNVILKNSIGDVLYPKIADNSVTTNKIASEAVTTTKISDGAITSLKIEEGGIINRNIADGTITKEKLNNKFLHEVLVDITSVTWYELKQLRDGNNLIPGHQYRITDYQCTTTQENTQSAGHQFDIIVTADDVGKLNEKARACPNISSINTYFKDSNLAAWQLWYCLDNDTNRFAWARANDKKYTLLQGKMPLKPGGVIYYKYDYTIYGDGTKVTYDNKDYYSFSYLEASDSNKKIFIPTEIPKVGDIAMFMTKDSSGNYIKDELPDDDEWNPGGTFNNITIEKIEEDEFGHGVIYRMIDEWNNDCPYDFKNILFKRWRITKASISSITGKYYSMLEDIGVDGWEVDSSDSKYFYTFSYLGKISDQTEYTGSVLKDASIIGNTLVEDTGVYNNSIKCISDSSSIQLNNIVFFTFSSTNGAYYGCYLNSFDNECALVSIGCNCCLNQFGNCTSSILDDNCIYNSFTNYLGIFFGTNCNMNVIKDGMICMLNSNCTQNLIYESSSNILGHDCDYNAFKCSGNIEFGNYCQYNILEGSNGIKLQDYYKNNKFSGAEYITFTGNGTESKYVQNYHIKQGMIFTDDSVHTITAKPGLEYELSVAKKSDGTVVEYNEADTHKLVSITDSDYAALTTKDSNTLYCIPE